MTRQDVHLDAMLRHLGAAYYDSLQNRAAPEDVKRAVAQVATELGEKAANGRQRPSAPAGQQHRPSPHHGRWHSRVRDVMTTSVVTVDRITPYKEIARLLVERQISGVPVLTLGRHVAGVVSEADLIAARDRDVARRRLWTGLLRYGTDRSRYTRLTAESLMTTPAVTIHPDAPIAAAARYMTSQHVKRLPVIDGDGKLVGLISRRDLLGVFLVPDAEIERQVRDLLAEVAPGADITAQVKGGIVTLTAAASRAAVQDAMRAAVDLAWDVDGVVDVIEHTASAA